MSYLLNQPQSSTSYFLRASSRREEKPKLETSAQLKELGAAYFELTGVSNSRVTLRLFDKAKVQTGTVELKLEKETTGATFVYTIHGADADAWIRISSQETSSSAIYRTVTSNEQEYMVRVQFAPVEQGHDLRINNKAVKAISTFSDGRWHIKTLPTFRELQQIRLTGRTLLQDEETKLFTSLQLKILQRVVLEIDDMTSQVTKLSGVPSSGRSLVTSPFDCDVQCFRISVGPVFVCDGGRAYCNHGCPEGKGVFLVPECVINIFCLVPCSHFGHPVLAFTSATDCVNAGASWDSTTSTCSVTSGNCASYGLSFDSSTGECTTSQTEQDWCDHLGWYWNFATNFCQNSPPPTPGTCGGWSNWTSYPSTGCITGFLFGGPCTRSSAFQSRCADPTGYDPFSCSCPDGTSMSPIVIDVDHSGYSMTSAAGGVVFNILNDGVPLPVSWTAADSTNALLVLDRDGNGMIDNGTELFGDITPQPASAKPNGFLALKPYDRPALGGNGNGRIDHNDAIFWQLRLWQDANHNGISESNELHTLPELGVRAIDLDYRESRRTDQYGNKFRYRSRVFDLDGGHTGRWAWDVFLTVVQ